MFESAKALCIRLKCVLFSIVSRLKAGCSQDWLPQNDASVFKGVTMGLLAHQS